ncbi:hypothetical protein XELAEV_18036858mg [Xenopus laevis]|uniref:Uncharacterized protein n=1 Tax=Xenopus laevis TaxID=8355 RepID=A0A974HA33_XENLA|nr:hypothetical protein XELAEV_18036858mg [Xenopus laevis]
MPTNQCLFFLMVTFLSKCIKVNWLFFLLCEFSAANFHRSIAKKIHTWQNSEFRCESVAGE